MSEIYENLLHQVGQGIIQNGFNMQCATQPLIVANCLTTTFFMILT